MIRTAVDKYGRLDVLFNNAGIEGLVTDTVSYPVDIFDKVIAVNLKGIWLRIKYAVPEMLKGGGGSIINTSSIAGLIGDKGFSAYCASKGGVIQLTRVAAPEYGKHGIRVNSIAPGDIVIDTDAREADSSRR